MRYELITTDAALVQFVAEAGAARTIAFDTEFVSEDTYRPDLCLIQVAADERLAIIDPKGVEDVSPFWRLVTQGEHETVVHAGREEFRFCTLATGQRPSRLCDVQIAAGLIGLEYPASYGTLASRLLGRSLNKGETRTDWRRRPLSAAQLEYALQDVTCLMPIRDQIYRRLDDLGRRAWLQTEMTTWQDDMEEAEERERWRRVSGISGLSPRAMAAVRELWRWREAEAERRNMPPRRVFRDDLIVELAKRQSDDPQRMRAVRGMERGDYQRHLPGLARAMAAAIALADHELPRSVRRELPAQLNLLGQFLTTALGSLCHNNDLAASLVGTAQDVRDLVAFRLGYWDASESPPTLAEGWRAEVIGHTIDELLDGRQAIFIRDPLADEPLAFESRKGKK